MPKLDLVERQISDFEEFDVRFKIDGRKARVEKPKGLAGYRGKFERKARQSLTVQRFKELRIVPHYGDYDVDVYYANGKVATGKTLLETVRKTYLRRT